MFHFAFVQSRTALRSCRGGSTPSRITMGNKHPTYPVSTAYHAVLPSSLDARGVDRPPGAAGPRSRAADPLRPHFHKAHLQTQGLIQNITHDDSSSPCKSFYCSLNVQDCRVLVVEALASPSTLRQLISSVLLRDLMVMPMPLYHIRDLPP